MTPGSDHPWVLEPHMVLNRVHVAITNMYPSSPRDEQRHYPIILQGLKHIGVMETPENVVDEDGGDEA
jgi:hypothetical protein